MLEKKPSLHKFSWYVMLVKMGKESVIKERILGNEDLEDGIKDLIVPEPCEYIEKEVVGDSINERHKDFLGYVFIKANLISSYYQILLEIDNVYRFLGNLHSGSYYIPSRIPEEQIETVKKYLKGNDNKVVEDNGLKVGAQVEITSGDLASITGRIIGLSENFVSIMPKDLFCQVVKVPFSKVAAC